MRKRIVPFSVALLLMMAGCSSSDPTASDEYAALEQELAQANRELAQMSEELAQAEVLLVETATEHDASVALSENIDEVEANETVNIAAFLDKDLNAMMDTFTEDVVFVDRTFGDHVVGRDKYTKVNADVIVTGTRTIRYASSCPRRASSLRSILASTPRSRSITHSPVYM